MNQHTATAGPQSSRASKKRATPHRISVTEAATRLHQLAAANLSDEELIPELLPIASGVLGAFGVLFLSRSEEHPGRLVIRPENFTPPHLSHLRSLLQHVSRLATVAAAEGAPQAGGAENGEDLLVVAVPVLRKTGGNEAICAVVSVSGQEQARSSAAYLIQVLTWVAAFLGKGQRRDALTTGGGSVGAARTYRMLNQAAQKRSLRESATVIAEWLKTQTGANEVVIGLRRSWRGSRVICYTGTQTMDHRSSRMHIFRELLEETAIASEIKSDNNAEQTLGDIAQQQSAKQSADVAVEAIAGVGASTVLPQDSLAAASTFYDQNSTSNAGQSLLDESVLQTSANGRLERETGLSIADRFALLDGNGKAYGSVLCLGDEKNGECEKTAAEVQRLLGQQLSLMKSARRISLFRMLGLHRLGKTWYRHPLVWGTVLALCALLLVPMPLQVKCDCIIQPKQRRFVSVPYEGRLEEVLTEPGETVRSGQLLARMDGHEIELELSSLRAELRKAEKDYDTALAAFSTAEKQKAGLEARRLKLKIESAQERLDNLEIRSPVDGVVIGGDPRKMEGSRLSIGETLLEVGPMQEMIVELEVLDEDISHIDLDQPVRYRLAALPWHAFKGRVNLIHPQSESRDASNVFIAEVSLQNDNELIRPGMRGQAKIRTDYHPLGWNLFHKAWDGLVSWVAW